MATLKSPLPNSFLALVSLDLDHQFQSMNSMAKNKLQLVVKIFHNRIIFIIEFY